MFWETFMLAQREIRRNVLRSTLTILGIVIGVAAVITLVTLGNGATQQVQEQIGSLGSNMLMLHPGQGFGPGGASGSSDPFDMDDVDALKTEISGLAGVAPTASSSTQAVYGNENWSTSITGASNDYFTVKNWAVETGDQFGDDDLKAGRAVCVIGTTIQEELFDDVDPIGQSIRLSGISFRVIGILESKGTSSFGDDQDDIILVPIKTFQRRISGSKDISGIMISVTNSDNIDKATANITTLMRERRQIAQDEEDDFQVHDMREIMNTMTGTTKVLTGLLGAVAAVSLLVGGIGIMNIMLVSVTERTREIGIRLAIGALASEVLMQFLVESVVLSCFGGIAGIVIGLGAAYIGAQIMHMPFVFQPGIVIIAFIFSSAVGVVFGYFPARKAAQLDPIDALRHE